jgi:hypothetical protein
VEECDTRTAGLKARGYDRRTIHFPVRVIAAVLIASVAAASAQSSAPTSQALARLWDNEHVSSPVSALVNHIEVETRLEALTSPLLVTRVGASLEGRRIYDVSFGSGPYVVMLWSQMHGDEGTATSALFDLYEYIAKHAETPFVQGLLKSLTVHSVPMLNPDGAERWQRRNVQGIDINRDALLLSTPEGQLLKKLRDEWQPKVGFNLHNQGWRTTVGNPPKGAAISLLSVAYDEAKTVNEGRLLTKKLAAVVRDALDPFIDGRIGKYDDAFEVRAFGDNLTKWGTPVLLIETGPYPEKNPDPTLVRLNFIALVRALGALADGSVTRADPARYDSLPMNDSAGLHTIIRNVEIVQGSGIPSFVGDVGINVTRRVRTENGARKLFEGAQIDDIGDLRTTGALFEVDGTGRVLAPAIKDVKTGQTIELPAWTKEKPSPLLVLNGYPADLMLLRKTADGRFMVERVFLGQEEVR